MVGIVLKYRFRRVKNGIDHSLSLTGFCNFNFHIPRPLFWGNFYRHRRHHHHHHQSSLKADLEMLQQYIHTLTSRLSTPPRSTSPTFYEQRCKFFYVPQESIRTVKECVKGINGFSSLSERTKLFTDVRTKAAHSP